MGTVTGGKLDGMAGTTDRCFLCKRSRVPLLVWVGGRLWLRRGYRREVFLDLPLEKRLHVRCLDRADCEAHRKRGRERQRLRNQRPEDAVLRELHPRERGTCRWCGGAIYRRDKQGRIVVDRRRLWHDGREVDPRAEPEPRCIWEYHAQAFTFRDQVYARDGGVCANCGYDHAAAIAAWEATRPSMGAELHEHTAWIDRRPADWHADHIIALEDGGEHALTNGATLCAPCHRIKTAAENSARARRRRRERARDAAQLALVST
jgi:hypothetical protein